MAAIDPAPRFAETYREPTPGVDVQVGVAEELPWDDAAFDAALSCLIIGFTRSRRGV